MITEKSNLQIEKINSMDQPKSKTRRQTSTRLRKSVSVNFSGLLLLFALISCSFTLPAQPLWQIGKADHSAAEFALAKNGYTSFLQKFGSPDHAFYIGLSDDTKDWPSVLPGPLDSWAGGNPDGSWDQMNTLPVGFVLESVPKLGLCTLTINILDASAEHPPFLRITVNNSIHEIEIPKGGGEGSLTGNYANAKSYEARIEFPV